MIMGTKAYRCLSNARFVLVTIVLIRGTIFGVSIWDMTRFRAASRLTGENSCE